MPALTENSASVSYSDAPFEVELRAPYRQAQALLAKRAGNLSGRMSLATYVPNHPDAPRWMAIVDGNGTWQKMVGVVEWGPASGQVRDCRFEGPVDSLGGVAWNSLEREIHKAPGGRGHLVVKEDAWGWCRDGKPVVVVLLVQSAGKLFLTTFPSGVAVVTSDGTLTIDTEVSPGEYPGPVIPTSIARNMWQANNATDGFSTWLRKTSTYARGGSAGEPGSHQKRRHLLPGDWLVGTEPIVPRRIASPRDAGCSQSGDVAFEDGAFGVCEPGVAFRQSQGADQEPRHLSPGD